VASPAFVKKHGKPKLEKIATLPLLGDPADRWKDWFAAFGGKAPARHVAVFDDTETLHQAAAQGLGVALARLTLAQPLIDSGRLVRLTPKRLKAEFAHYLVYPQRSLLLPGFQTMRGWLLQQAAVAR
jgi:LysR family transcriptional regulator, glycine cleavage system transcriptional activator